jgi:hypothetical protein
MKVFRSVALLGILLIAVSAAYADGIIDPRIVIGGDTASVGVLSSFSFMSNANGGGLYADTPNTQGNGGIGVPTFGTGLYNASGVDWTSLLITAPIPNAGPNGLYILQSTLFLNATISFSSNTLSILFSGTGFAGGNSDLRFIAPGIKAGDHFLIDLNDVTGVDGGGWLSGGSPMIFQAQANPAQANLVPEPGSFVLLLGGLGMLAAGLARRKR